MQFVQHQPRTHTLRHTRAHTRHSHWVQISLLNNFAATWSWSWHELGLRLVSCLDWSLGSVCSVSLCPFLSLCLSVSRSVAKLASNSCQKRRRKLRPNQMDLLVSEIKPRNETKWVNCGFKFSQLLGCCCCCCLPPSIANHIHKPHTTAHPHTHTHTFCLVACVLPWQCVSLCHFLQFVRKTTLVVKIFNTCCILLGASGRGRSGCACYAIAWKRCLNIWLTFAHGQQQQQQ